MKLPKILSIWEKTNDPLIATTSAVQGKIELEKVEQVIRNVRGGKGCSDEEKRQVQHFGITLRQLWRSNEQPSWFTVQAEGETEIGGNRWARIWRTEHTRRSRILDETQQGRGRIWNGAKGYTKERIRERVKAGIAYWFSYWWVIQKAVKKYKLKSGCSNWETDCRKRQTEKEKQRDCYWHQQWLIDSAMGGRSALWVSGACGLGEGRERM